MKPKDYVSLFNYAFQDWSDDRVPMLGAALAYYTIFAIGPLVVVLTTFVGLIFGEAVTSQQIMDLISKNLGPNIAELIGNLVQNRAEKQNQTTFALIGLIVLIFGAMAIFGQLKNALNIIWEAPRDTRGLLGLVLGNLLSFGTLMFLALLMAVLLIVNSILAVIAPYITDALPAGAVLWQGVGILVQLATFFIAFAFVFKVLPDVRVLWSDVWLGSIITAILFLVGQFILSFYLSRVDIGSAFGSASSLIVFLVFIYYSSQLVFFGAEITQVYANNFGSRLGRPQLRTLRLIKRKEGRYRPPAALVVEPKQESGKSPWFS